MAIATAQLGTASDVEPIEENASGLSVDVRRRQRARVYALTAWLRERQYSERSVELYVQLVWRAARHLEPSGVTLDKATLADLHGFWSTIPPSRESRGGVRHALMAYYKSRGDLDGDPARRLPSLPAPHRLPRPIAGDDYERLLTAARQLGGLHRVAGEMLALTGCRFGELRKAAWHQFDLGSAHPVWYIEGKGSGRRGAKIRQVPLHPDLVATLVAHRAGVLPTKTRFPLADGTAAVFPSAARVDGTPTTRDGHMSPSCLRGIVAEIAEAAGVTGATPHRWRHTVATLALENTNDLRGVQEFLGHASLATTQLYTSVVASRLTNIVDSLPVATQPATPTPGGTP